MLRRYVRGWAGERGSTGTVLLLPLQVGAGHGFAYGGAHLCFADMCEGGLWTCSPSTATSELVQFEPKFWDPRDPILAQRRFNIRFVLIRPELCAYKSESSLIEQ